MRGFLAVNAIRRTVTDYAGDPAADARARGLMGDVLARAQGRLTRVYIGDQSDPSRTYNGGRPVALQHFTGTGAANRVLYADPMQATLEAQTGTTALDDPTSRILLDRLRRRQ